MAETVNEYRETDLGNVAPNPRGDYSETAEYEYLDLVAYAGGSYMCILEEGTVTGTAPTPGKTTEIWQEVSRPGNLTPEYVAMHDDVVNKAASVAADAASTAVDREQVEGMKENVAALQEQTAQDAQLTKEYRESAAGYASAAETSRTAAGESEENVRALVNGFDDHVEEQKTSAQDDITTSRQAAINAIAAQQVSSVNTVKQEGQKAINKINADAEATAADRTAVSEMAATVDGQATQVAQNAAQVAEDKATAENYMQTAGESKKQALEAAERLKDSVNLVQKNTVDLQGKAPAIIGSATSYGTPVEVNDSAEMQLQGLRLYGKSKQVVTTGKNHLNPYLKKSTTVNGVTCVPNGDGTYTLNGTATEKADFIVFTISKISSSSLFGKTLKIVGCPPGGKRDSKYAFYFQRQLAPNYTPIIADEGNGSSSLEINDSIDGAWSAWIRIHSGYTCNNLVFKPMITTDLSATYDDFEPYTGGKPSPSPEYPQEIVSAGEKGSIGVEITGKNLFDLSKEYTSDTVVNTFTFTLKPSTKYTLSTDFPATVNVASIYFGGSSSNINGVWKDRPKTFATDSSGNITVKIRTLEQDNAPAIFNDVLNGVYHIQLEEGNTATSYEPYKTPSTTTIPLSNGLPGIPVNTGGNYTDENGQQYICDEIDFSRGKYVQRVWKGVFDGSSDEEWSEHWREETYTTRIKWSDLVLPRKFLCNQYICGNGIGQVDSLLDNGQLHLYFNYDNGTIGMDAFKALIASNPLVVMTYLDTPIETELTQEQLQAYKSLTTLKPTCIISNDAGALMEVKYVEDTKAYIDGLNDAADTRIDVLTETIAENKKADKLVQRRIDVLWKLSQGIVYEFQSDDVDGYKKDVPAGGKYVGLKQIGGKSLVWGQLYPYDFTSSAINACLNNCTISVKDRIATLKTVDLSKNVDCNFGSFFENSASPNHKYLVSEEVKALREVSIGIFRKSVLITNTYKKVSNIIQATKSGSLNYLSYVALASGLDVEVNFKNVQLFDLTAMFGAGNEPSTVEEFEAMFPDDYYPYSDPEVVHASIETVESVGKNSTNTLIIPEAIRNLDGYGWSAGNAYNYVDFENKKFHKRVGCVDLGTLEWTSKTDCYFRAVLSTIKPGKNEKVSNGCCKKYLLYDANRLMRVTKGIALGVNHSNNVDVRDENYTDVTTFKTAMSGAVLYYELATEEVTDISDLLAELDEGAFVLPVEAGGTLTFKNSLGDGYRIPVPNSEEYVIKLSEVAGNE